MGFPKTIRKIVFWGIPKPLKNRKDDNMERIVKLYLADQMIGEAYAKI